MYLRHSPAWQMSQPGEKLNRVSTHKSSLEKTLSEIVDGLDVTIFFRHERRVAIEDRQCRRCRGATKMLVPSRMTAKQVTSQKDSLRHLRFVELSNRAFTETLICCPPQPTPAEWGSFLFIQDDATSLEGRDAHVSPYGANPSMRPPVMMSHAITLRGLSEYIAARRSSNSTAAF